MSERKGEKDGEKFYMKGGEEGKLVYGHVSTSTVFKVTINTIKNIRGERERERVRDRERI